MKNASKSIDSTWGQRQHFGTILNFWIACFPPRQLLRAVIQPFHKKTWLLWPIFHQHSWALTWPSMESWLGPAKNCGREQSLCLWPPRSSATVSVLPLICIGNSKFQKERCFCNKSASRRGTFNTARLYNQNLHLHPQTPLNLQVPGITGCRRSSGSLKWGVGIMLNSTSWPARSIHPSKEAQM